jgi:ribosomal protein L17
MTTEQNNYISQQNEPRNYTSEEKMMIIQLAGVLYTPEKIQTLWEMISAMNKEIEHLNDVEKRADLDYGNTHAVSVRMQLNKTIAAASRKRKMLQQEYNILTKEHHLLVKLKSFEEEVKAPYEPNDGMVDL